MAGRTRLHSEILFGENAQDSAVDDISFRNPKKRILFDDDSSKTAVDISEHMKCYLRIRPFSEEEEANNEDQHCLTIEDENTVATHAPKESNTFKNCTHGLGKTTHKFKFSRIFDSATSQKLFFNETMLGLVKDFIDGQNCLVFTYGVTSSGKTYTIQGKPKESGILPRALDVLFNSINGKQWPSNNLKPKMFMDVTKLTPEQSAEELKIKERTMKMVTFDEPDVMSLLGDDASDMSQITNTTSCSESSNASYGVTGQASKESLDEVFSDLENRVREEAAVSVEDQGLMKFSVWISFAEIYNEQIFDLLEPTPKKKTTRRPVLRLSDDKNGSPYIRGLKEIHVTSADEAYNLLTVGQKNLRTACTKLNHQSSRSHCIFNIKILRVVDKGFPNHARVSMLSLCDLAGSERHSKTLSKGDRLKEAGNINTSLMTLGRCIEILRNNQHHKDRTQLIPFRDSKLTRLFQNFFCGRGKAAMIVNVNQCASMFDETLHVFKFSAVAKQVVVTQKPDPPPKKRLKSIPPPRQVPRPSIPWATPGARDTSMMNYALKKGQELPLPEDDDEDIDDDGDSMDDSESAELVRIIESLKDKLRGERHGKLIMERDIREEVCKEMMEQIVKIEHDYEEQLKEREIMAEEMMERRLKIITDSMANPRKRPRQEVMEDEDDEWVSSILLHQEKVKVQKCNEELKTLKGELDTVKTQLNKYITEQESYMARNTSLQFKLADTEKTLEKSQKAEKEARKEIRQLNNKLDKLVSDAVDKKRNSEVDLGDSCLLETLTQQLQQAKDQIKEQEDEIQELNAMLTEAGETFQQKDLEISQLKEVINEDEEKLKLQQNMVSELQAALVDSKKAVNTAEERLVKKDEKIIKLECENSEFQENLKHQKNCNTFLEETLEQKNEEITGWKNKLAREEAESFKREQALINGYKAEINNLKVQIHQLKAEYQVCSPQKSPTKKIKECESPVKKFKEYGSPSKKLRLDSPSRREKDTESPRKAKLDSPARKVNSTLDGDSVNHFKEDLSRQIRDLQDEFMKNSSATAELESALQVARMTSEDLESRLEVLQKAKQEAEVKVEELTSKLKDSQSKYENEADARKESDLQVEKLTLELKELTHVRDSFKELQDNFSELEKNTATKIEENLIAETKIKTLDLEVEKMMQAQKNSQQKLKSFVESLPELTTAELEQEVLKMKDTCNVQDVQNNNKELEVVVITLELKMRECKNDVHEKSVALSSSENLVMQLKNDLNESEEKNSKLTEKFEEIETVNASLREMVNQATNQIQKKESEIKEIVVESLQSCDSPSSDSLSNLRKKMRDLKDDCEKLEIENSSKSNEIENLEKDIEKARNSKTEIENKLKKLSEKCKDLEFQFEEKTIEITDMKESKVSTEAKVNELECKYSELENVSKEKTKQVLELNDELNKGKVAREMLEADLRDMEEEKEELQAIIETNSDLKKVNTDLKKDYDSREKEIKDIREEMKTLQRQCDDQEETIVKLKNQISKFESGEISQEESLKQSMATLEKEKENLKRELTEKEASFIEEKEQWSGERNGLENQIESLRNELQNMSEIIYGKEKQLNDLNTQMDQKENLINHLQSQQQQVDQFRHVIIEEKNKLVKEFEETKAEFYEVENKVGELRKELEMSSEERDYLKSQVTNVSNEKDSIQEDYDKLQIKFAELQSINEELQKESSDSEQSSLGEARLQIAELKSSLHMHKTLHDKVKSEIAEQGEIIAQLEKENKNLKEKLENENVDMESVLNSSTYKSLMVQYDECMNEKEKLESSYTKLKADLEESNTKNETLQHELSSSQQESSELSNKKTDKLSKACTQQEMLIREQNLKIKKFENFVTEKQSLLNEIENSDKKCRELEKENCQQKSEVKEYLSKLEVSDQEVKNLNEAVSQQQKIICQQADKIKQLVHCDSNSSNSGKQEVEELKSELHRKSEELQGYLDKLNKVENDLVKINNELSGKEQVIQNLKENLDQLRESECLSPTSQSNCARKLRKEKIEIENQLIEARYRIKQLENEAHSGLLSSPRRTVQSEYLQRASVTSPTVHRELNKSHEREQNLRSQLQQASCTMKQQNEKISELEKQLLEAGTKLREAEDKQRQSLYGLSKDGPDQEEMRKLREEHAKRWEMIQTMEKDLQKKETKIQGKTQAVKELKQSMEKERDNFEAALKDAKSNEAVIEELKNAIALQEETMEEQDRYIQQKEETITKLQQEVEKFTDKYHQLLTTSGDSGREMREITRENARLSAEIEQLKRSVEDLKSKLQKLEAENLQYVTEIKDKIEESNELESLLKQKREECERLNNSVSGNSKFKEEIENLQNNMSDNLKFKEEVEHLRKTIEELKRSNQKMADDKLLLSTVIKENNEELKEMEKVLSDKRKECEDLRSQNNTEKLQSLELKCQQDEGIIIELKNKVKDKDHSLRDGHKEIRNMNEELTKVKHDLQVLQEQLKEKNHSSSEFSKQIQHKNEEIIKLQRAVEDKTSELNNWKLERDKLVQGLEAIMKKQQKEINDLKKQKTELEMSQQTTGRTRHRSTTQHEKIIHVTVPDSTDDVIIKQEVSEVFQSPPRKTSSRRGRKRKSPTPEIHDCDMPSSSKKEVTDDNVTFVSEEGDTSNHIEIDATPAIAAKNLRKSRKKRSSVDLLRVFRKESKEEEKENKTTRGRKPRATKTSESTPETSNGRGLSRIGSIMSAIKESPITRSAKKFLEDITEVTTPNKDSDSMVEVEDHGTQMSPAVEVTNKRGTSRKKHALYKDTIQISEPIDCGNFISTPPEEVHNTVQRKLRGRRK